ncbi:minor tail protein [Streptomyces phage Lilbooboo]|uniref:Minor tail protein n=1 Tax=Streptomyces phage Lilbooboo TaxID=2510571 RepID=A0A411B2Y5_9CAUD|nr:minor tail protein [Streptomyces phage Lilbooboo]QAX94715.1 minor tail protein [Streptomyces phage Lilbooboo]
MPDFEVLQVEAKTGDVIATLPVTGISYGETLNAAGTATIGMPLDAADPETLTPGRAALVVLRDGEPDWGGMLWTATADLNAGTLALNASGWHSYYGACYLGGWVPREDGGGRILGKWGGYKGTKDQALLLTDWIEWANDNGGIGTDTSRLTTTGKIRSREWGFSEFKNIAEAINELADEDGGFDFRYETYWANAARTRIGNRLLKSPRVSLTFPTLTHRLDADVSQVAYDGSKLATRAWAFGADMGTGVKPYHSVVNDLDTPSLTQVVTYGDLKATADLVPKAAALAAVGRQVIAIPTLHLYPGVYDPASFVVGSHGTVNVDSGYVRLLEEFVITERRIDVDVNGTETAALSLASKEVFVSGDSS